jgi:hypothetical protein
MLNILRNSSKKITSHTVFFQKNSPCQLSEPLHTHYSCLYSSIIVVLVSIIILLDITIPLSDLSSTLNYLDISNYQRPVPLVLLAICMPRYLRILLHQFLLTFTLTNQFLKMWLSIMIPNSTIIKLEILVSDNMQPPMI